MRRAGRSEHQSGWRGGKTGCQLERLVGLGASHDDRQYRCTDILWNLSALQEGCQRRMRGDAPRGEHPFSGFLVPPMGRRSVGRGEHGRHWRGLRRAAQGETSAIVRRCKGSHVSTAEDFPGVGRDTAGTRQCSASAPHRRPDRGCSRCSGVPGRHPDPGCRAARGFLIQAGRGTA